MITDTICCICGDILQYKRWKIEFNIGKILISGYPCDVCFKEIVPNMKEIQYEKLNETITKQ